MPEKLMLVTTGTSLFESASWNDGDWIDKKGVKAFREWLEPGSLNEPGPLISHLKRIRHEKAEEIMSFFENELTINNASEWANYFAKDVEMKPKTLRYSAELSTIFDFAMKCNDWKSFINDFKIIFMCDESEKSPTHIAAKHNLTYLQKIKGINLESSKIEPLFDISELHTAVFQKNFKKLKEYFDISNLGFTNFEIINSFLIYQTIKNSKINSLIYFPDKKSKSKFYIPSIFILALYNFIDNYLDDSTVVQVGDIVQKAGLRYKVIRICNDEIVLEDKNRNLKEYIKGIDLFKRNFIITTASLAERKVKIKFDLYKIFFTEILKLKGKNKNSVELPSKFKYKAVIVTDKKIVDELKKYEINGRKIYR